jgi:hypothetical protein
MFAALCNRSLGWDDVIGRVGPFIKKDVKGGTTGLNIGTCFPVGRTSYRDWLASRRVETITSASFLNSDQFNVDPLHQIRNFFF